MEQLTEKQARVLESIKKFIAKNGYPPTVREIGSMINLRSSATIHAHITLLEEKGYLKKGMGKNRTIELLVPNEFQDKKDGVVSIPLLNSNHKFDLEKMLTDVNEYIQVSSSMIDTKNEVFALVIKDSSKAEDGIYNQDILIIEKMSEANDQDIIVIATNNQLVVEKYSEKTDQTIVGKVIGLYRKF